MVARLRYGVLIAGVLGVGAAAEAAAQADSLPDGITSAMISSGKKLFGGEGLCLACHGPDGKGVIGPDLTDKTWLHGKGSYAEIVARVFAGVGSDSSRSGQIMPPRGGSGISDEQVRAVAAYVWTLSNRSKKKGD
ncbi:MAG: cytochrome c [Gemmatimonadales bacterium]